MATLEEWEKNGWLIKHKTSSREVADLAALADRDIEACQTPGLHPDWAFNIAYNACLQLASIALAAAGYRAERMNHHFRVIQSLELTIAMDQHTIRMLDVFRKKRNISDYERMDVVSDMDVREIRQLAQKLRLTLAKWISIHYPDLSA